MKDIKTKIIIFAIGLLAGAVISTGAFCAYTLTNNNHNCKNKVMQISRGQQPPSMNNQSNSQNGQAPNTNDSSSSQSNNQNGQPPAMPSDNSTQNNNTQNNNN